MYTGINSRFILTTGVLLLFTLVPGDTIIGAPEKADSLKNELKKNLEDTSRISALNALGWELMYTNPDTAIILSTQALALAEGLPSPFSRRGAGGEVKQRLLATSHRQLGVYTAMKGNYPQALQHFFTTLEILEKFMEQKPPPAFALLAMAATVGSIGNVYLYQADYPKALDYYLKALKMAEELGNKNHIAAILGNIGIVYHEQADYPKALDYYLKALKMAEELGNKQLQANTLGSIGVVYKDQADLSRQQGDTAQANRDYHKALDYYFKALKIAEELGNKNRIAIWLGNIGIVYHEQAEAHPPDKVGTGIPSLREGLYNKVHPVERDSLLNRALDYYLKALKMAEELGDKNGIAIWLGNIGLLYTKTGKFAEAEQYLKKAIAIDSAIGAQDYLRQFEESLSQLYDTTAQLATGNMQYAKAAEKYKLSLLHYKKAMVLKDTIFSEENKKQLIRKEMTYQFEKKELAAQAEQEKKDAVAAEESKRQRLFLWLIVAVAVAVAVIAAIIFRSLRVTRKQKHVIELQKDEVTRQRDIVEKQKAVVEKQKEELAVKNKDITDSIRYAKEIQQAILPPVEDIKKALPESFVLFKPKDIVSGDFYFFTKVNKDIIIAACDSTGHGVPDAFMSMIGSQLLNEIVNDKSVNDAAEVLNQLRDGIIHAFGEAGATGRQKDGMDMALCVFQYKKDGSGVLLQYAGANNPLYIVRKNNITECRDAQFGRLYDDNLTVINADKQAVGYNFGTDSPFTNHNVVLQKGDTFYIFSDGYQDQFGGPDVKKFMKRRFRQLFSDICEKSMEEQKELMDKTIEEWKGNGVQVDDILVIGVRV